MIELARRLFEAEKKRKKQEKSYVKALLHYHEGHYRKAARLFSKLITHEAIYMSILSHARTGNKLKALQRIHDYLNMIETWPESDEKAEAVERIKEIKRIIR